MFKIDCIFLISINEKKNALDEWPTSLKVMRVNKKISKGKLKQTFNKFSQLKQENV